MHSAEIDIIGSVDSEVKRPFLDNQNFVTISIAVREKYKSKEGDMKDKTQWFSVSTQLEYLRNKIESLSVGDLVRVRGALQIRTYQDKNNETKISTGIYPAMINKLQEEESFDGFKSGRAVLRNSGQDFDANALTDDDIPFLMISDCLIVLLFAFNFVFISVNIFTAFDDREYDLAIVLSIVLIVQLLLVVSYINQINI